MIEIIIVLILIIVVIGLFRYVYKDIENRFIDIEYRQLQLEKRVGLYKYENKRKEKKK